MASQLRAATALFGGAIIGVELDVAQQAQSRANPAIWDYVSRSNIWGGHDIFGGSYTGEAGNDEQIVSWLKRMGMTDNFEDQQIQEVFVVLLPIMMEHDPILQGVDWPELASDYQALTGRPFPVPIPQPAPPAPAPPNPSPMVDPDATLSAAFQAWQKAKGIT
jgi:hypothetical protein